MTLEEARAQFEARFAQTVVGPPTWQAYPGGVYRTVTMWRR